ncbi:phosphatase PAP2 family protein [Actinomadura rubrisoli]|uniref:Phosphatase PAP2 family protein n=1 Tax=Actinomadura rubrisoli TaxID=2530368 RepID=A0A4R5CCP8_9ACTN|nr:phosphatase PAP2 family protein [Actinomadura rubrisoli]
MRTTCRDGASGAAGGPRTGGDGTSGRPTSCPRTGGHGGEVDRGSGCHRGAHRPGRHRPRLWQELLLLALCYLAYQTVRNLVPTDHAIAAHRAYEILNLEYDLRFNVEYSLNRLFVTHGWLAVGANYFYATAHFAVTIAVMVWLYVWRPAHYARYRTLLFATTVLGLIGFWIYPLAPPRMLPGFTDTVITFGTWGIYDSGPTASLSNQYAAMPSMHTAWSLWCAAAVIAVTRRRWAMVLAALYPAATIVVIMGTANHFLLDAVGGGAAVAGGLALTRGAFLAVALARPAHESSAPRTPG